MYSKTKSMASFITTAVLGKDYRTPAEVDANSAVENDTQSMMYPTFVTDRTNYALSRDSA